ncbi:MAG: hypothetical protein KJP14_06170 [Eudoraea sp.]|nr:hypothetical protein [Eudoraea sp.]MBT8210097.1 hypothetical protein [Eudoraea sp.]MBT8222662.1 hypothetical protein [Eudoraea sp.]NNK30400.1 hypothetical protein [Flavobacteriaceae bacterium]
MKYPFALLLGILLGVSGCSSQKKIGTDAPFSVEKPSCTPFASGREESGHGFILRLPLSFKEYEDISYDAVYFRGHILTPMLLEEVGKQVLYCRYQRTPKVKPDIIMHDDPIKEVGNQPPAEKVGKKKFPFELQPAEAVIAYRIDDRIKYVKITGVKDKTPELLPTRPNN